MSASAPNLESLGDRLKKAEVYEEFSALMFDQEMHYEELLEQLEQWGISSSMGALSRFKASHRGTWSMERAKRQEKAFLESQGVELDEATRKSVAMRIFMDAASPNTSTKDVLKMKDLMIREAGLQADHKKLENDVKLKERSLEQKDRSLEQAERKLKLLEDKVGNANEAMEDKALTDEEKVARWKQVFGR